MKYSFLIRNKAVFRTASGTAGSYITGTVSWKNGCQNLEENTGGVNIKMYKLVGICIFEGKIFDVNEIVFIFTLHNLLWLCPAFGGVFSSPEPKARVSYCHSAPSVVRPSVRPSSGVRPASVVVRKLSHFQLLLPNRLMDFDETW